jgi:hypothetical protein
MALTTLSQAQPPYPVVVGSFLKTGVAIAAIGSTTIVANAPPGIYRYTAIVIITTLEAAHTVTVNAIVTDDLQAETVAIISAASTAATGQFNGTQVLENTATANLNFSVTTTDTGTAVGNIYIIVERIF